MVFSISSNQVASAQNNYQKIVEAILKQLLESTLNNKPEIQGLKIFKDDKLIYGYSGEKFINQITGTEGEILNPQMTENIRKLRDSPVGTVIKSAANIKVEFDGKVILESNQDGQVITNSLQTQIKQSNHATETNSHLENVEDRQSLPVVKENIDTLDEDLLPAELELEFQELEQTISEGKTIISRVVSDVKIEAPENNQSKESLKQQEDSDSIDNLKSSIEDLNDFELQQNLNSDIQSIIQDCERFQADIQKTQNLLKDSVEKLKNYQQINTDIQNSTQTLRGARKNKIPAVKPISLLKTNNPSTTAGILFNGKCLTDNSSEIENTDNLQSYNSFTPDFIYPEDAIKYIDDENTITPISSNQDQNQDLEGVNQTSSARIMEALNSLENEQLKSLVTSELEKLQLEIKLLQKERNAYKAMLEQRLQNEPTNITWWQDLKQTVSTLRTNLSDAIKLNLIEFNKNSQRHEYAKGILKLFNSQAQDNVYDAKDYRITNENGIFTVDDVNNNRQIIQFRPTMTGTKILEFNLNEKDIQALSSLKKYTQTINPSKQHLDPILPTSFQAIGESESQRIIITNNIADTLSDYAKAQGYPVHITGKSSYIWNADLKGNVTIKNKDNEEIIFQRQNGQVYDAMKSRDISYFQNSLSALQKIIQQKYSHQSHFLSRVKNVAQTIHNITHNTGKPIKFNGDNFYGQSNKEHIQIFRKQDNQLIFNYSHQSKKITHNHMTSQDLSQIENDLAKISLPQKQQTHNKPTNELEI